MMINKPQAGLRALLLSSSIALLTACGGGGGGGGTPVPAASVISGTAAAGAPIIGQVTVKDAKGTMRTKDIQADGRYSLDVSGLIAPFVFRAQGQVGGRGVILVSAATSADINGNINITPFTDLIVANMAGQLASSYFDTPTFSTLTAAELNAAKDTLTQRLLPILSNLGVTSGFDLLRSAFSANHTGIDAVMDVVRVTVDPATNTALIQDLVNSTQISDNLLSQTDNTVLPAPIIALGGAVTDLQAIEAQLAAFSTLFASAIPAPTNSNLLGFFVSDGSFLNGGRILETFLNEITSDPEIMGIALSHPSILEYIDASTLRVAILATESNGLTESFDWVMKKVGGSWKVTGDQLPIDNSLHAVNARWLPSSDRFGNSWLMSTPRYERKLSMWVDYAPAGIDYIRVTGPGLMVSGVVAPMLLHRSATTVSGFVPVKSDGITDTNGGWVGECGDAYTPADEPCVDFSLISLNSVYTFEVLDTNKAVIAGKPSFTRTLPRAAASNADAQTNASQWFASFSSITPANYSALTDGSNIHVGLTLPTDSSFRFGSAHYQFSGTLRIEARSLAADGHSVDFTWSGAAPTGAPSLYVWTKDIYSREFVTFGQHNPL